MEKLLTAAANLVALFAATLYGGWVIAVLWGWYAVPLGYAAITLKTALGAVFLTTALLAGVVVLLAFIRYELAEHRGVKLSKYDSLWTSMMFAAIYSTALFGGWFYNWIL